MLNPSLNLNRLVTAVWMFCLACVSWADPTAHQGIYLKTAQGYTELAPVENMDGLEYDYSRHLLKLPVIEGEELELTLVIHQQDFSPHWAGYDVRDMESPAAGQRLKPVKVEELAENKYQVTLKLAARNQHFLLIDTGCCRQSQVYGPIPTRRLHAFLLMSLKTPSRLNMCWPISCAALPMMSR
jgi:hypothetical protein